MMARPSEFTQEAALSICSRLATGEPLVKICDSDDLPHVSTVYRWLAANESFRDMYARAREDQADTLADEIIAISDEQRSAITRDGTVYDPEVNRDRLRIDARKWVAAKLRPRKYGDKLELGGDPDNPLQVVIGKMGEE